jgi:hypothetical protein
VRSNANRRNAFYFLSQLVGQKGNHKTATAAAAAEGKRCLSYFLAQLAELRGDANPKGSKKDYYKFEVITQRKNLR